jgi:hypothetical protein
MISGCEVDRDLLDRHIFEFSVAAQLVPPVRV